MLKVSSRDRDFDNANTHIADRRECHVKNSASGSLYQQSSTGELDKA